MENYSINAIVKEYTAPPVDRREVLRYAGVRESYEAAEKLLDGCIAEAEGRLKYLTVHCRLTENDLMGLLPYSSSKLLTERLSGCHEAILL